MLHKSKLNPNKYKNRYRTNLEIILDYIIGKIYRGYVMGLADLGHR